MENIAPQPSHLVFRSKGSIQYRKWSQLQNSWAKSSVQFWTLELCSARLLFPFQFVFVFELQLIVDLEHKRAYYCLI